MDIADKSCMTTELNFVSVDGRKIQQVIFQYPDGFDASKFLANKKSEGDPQTALL
jgi:hypothetical protein